MTASDIWLDELHRRDLDDAIGQARLALHAREETLHRLLRTAFRDPLIVEKFHNQVALRGPDAAVEIAQGRHALPRWLWFGRLRGNAIASPGLQAEAKASLDQLPDAVRSFLATRDELRDLTAMRVRVQPTGRDAQPRDSDRDHARLHTRLRRDRAP
jgi:hypothetical protein